MKKILVIYLSILLGVFLGLYGLGLKGNYGIEKKVWQLYKKQIDIAKDPAVVPDATFDRVIAGYKQLIDKNPQSDLLAGLYFRLGETYALKEDHEMARKVFQDVIALYPDHKELSAEAMFKGGKTYEVVGDWEQASVMYNDIIKAYPQTPVGLSLPIYIASYYRRSNDFQKTMDSYEFAVAHYKKMASDYEGAEAGLMALRYLSNCYLEQNRWSEAVQILGVVLEKYAASGHLTEENIDMVIKTINVVSAFQLKDYDVARKMYQGIIDRNPSHRLNNYLKKVINAFNQLEQRDKAVSGQE